MPSVKGNDIDKSQLADSRDRRRDAPAQISNVIAGPGLESSAIPTPSGSGNEGQLPPTVRAANVAGSNARPTNLARSSVPENTTPAGHPAAHPAAQLQSASSQHPYAQQSQQRQQHHQQKQHRQQLGKQHPNLAHATQQPENTPTAQTQFLPQFAANPAANPPANVTTARPSSLPIPPSSTSLTPSRHQPVNFLELAASVIGVRHTNSPPGGAAFNDTPAGLSSSGFGELYGGGAVFKRGFVGGGGRWNLGGARESGGALACDLDGAAVMLDAVETALGRGKAPRGGRAVSGVGVSSAVGGRGESADGEMDIRSARQVKYLFV